MQLDAFGEIKPLRYTQVEVYKGWSSKGVAAWPMIDRIECSITIRIFERDRLPAVVKSTLRAEDATHLKLPWQFHQSIELKHMVH